VAFLFRSSLFFLVVFLGENAARPFLSRRKHGALANYPATDFAVSAPADPVKSDLLRSFLTTWIRVDGSRHAFARLSEPAPADLPFRERRPARWTVSGRNVGRPSFQFETASAPLFGASPRDTSASGGFTLGFHGLGAATALSGQAWLLVSPRYWQRALAPAPVTEPRRCRRSSSGARV